MASYGLSASPLVLIQDVHIATRLNGASGTVQNEESSTQVRAWQRKHSFCVSLTRTCCCCWLTTSSDGSTSAIQWRGLCAKDVDVKLYAFTSSDLHASTFWRRVLTAGFFLGMFLTSPFTQQQLNAYITTTL